MGIFYNNKKVKVILFDKDKRVRISFVIPEQGNVTIGDKSYVINDKDFFIDKKGYPTYSYRVDSTEPIDPFNTNKSVLTPDYYNTAINSHVARDIFEATGNKMDMATISMVISFMAFIAAAAAAYFTFSSSESIMERLNELREVLRTIGGV